MKVRLSRVISVFMVLVILTVAMTFVSAAAPQYENSGLEYLDKTTDATNIYNQIKNSLPKTPQGGIPPQCLGETFSASDTRFDACFINYRLWSDKGILVYGNCSKVPGNDFKQGTQPSSGVQLTGVNDGYYRNPYGDPNRGEWRYHGYDVSGNKFSNINFIDDVAGPSFDERNWVKKPWENLPYNKKPTKSIYNKAATQDNNEGDFTAAHVQTWINKSLDMYHGVPLIGNKLDPEVFQYLNVLSAPTPLQFGQGRMWHTNDNGGTLYQTITIPAIVKENLPVTATITPVTSITIQDVGTYMDSQSVTLQFKVTAVLNDTEESNDAVKRTIYYTHEDIKSWKLTFTPPSGMGGGTITQQGVPKVGSSGSYVFSVDTTYGYLRSHNWKLSLAATGQPLNDNNTWGNSDNANLDYTIGITPAPSPPQSEFFPGFTPNNNIPEVAFDGVPFFASDSSNMSMVASRKVYVNGQPVNGTQFFSGSYMFNAGDIGVNGKFAYVDVIYDLYDFALPDGKTINTHDVVYIYPTKPIANLKISSNTWKQNRIIKVEDTSAAGNIQLVVQNFPIVAYEWSFGGDTSQIKTGTDTASMKEFLCKQPGIYSATMRCKNTLGKWSDPYTVQFEVLPDIEPAIGLNLNGSVTNRNKAMDAWYYTVCSTDGDVIKTASIELWYDSNNDGTVDTKINTWDGIGQFPSYTPTKLGYYKYVVKAKEDIVGDTLPQYLTAEDKKSNTYEVEWWVDNYRPMSDLYVNIPIQRPNIDVYFLLDKNLPQAKTDYMNSSKMDISNWLIGKNIIPNVDIWDMRTYTYSQPASTTVHTGGSYPSSTTPYTSSGYSGTLPVTSVSNNSYSRDEGSYTTQTESKTVSQGASNTNSSTYRWTGSSWSMTSTNQNQLPGTRSYSDGSGFSGTLYKGGASLNSESGSPPSNPSVGSTYTHYWYWSCTYSGSVSRSVRVWVPKIVWYNDYTGSYSGTIYKDVRQPYTDPFNPTSTKYVVYISDGTVSDLSDLNMVMGYARSARVILAGTSAIQSQITSDKYFDATGKPIDVLANSILEYISESSTAVEKYFVLQNQAFTLNVGNLDLENDTITTQEMQYVHTSSYFDNPTGTEPGTAAAYSDTGNWTTPIKGSFANTGMYEIYRRVKDKPSIDPNFAQYSYYSGATKLEIYVHRKPIALCSLDWDFNNISGVYSTKWVDMSYDPDHNISRQDKGIADRKIMYRPLGGEWIYNIPDSLTPGSTYELLYYVKDIEGVWSDPYTMTFIADTIPQVQMTANLRTLDSKFGTAGIPASEFLEYYDIRTRYPTMVHLEAGRLTGGTIGNSTKRTVLYNNGTGTKNGNDITWNNISCQVPSTLPDGKYTYRMEAIADNGQKNFRDFPVTVSTPVNLAPHMPDTVTTNGTTDINAVTAKYASTCQVTLYSGTAYQAVVNLTPATVGGLKNWSVSHHVPSAVPDGTYTARFSAATPNGNIQTVDVSYKVQSLAITGVTIDGYWNHWRGQTDLFGKRLSNEPHRFLSLETVKINVSTVGFADKVVIRFSPELEAMGFTDENGHSYDYSEYLGYRVSFPKDTTFVLDSSSMEGHVYWEYSLPLAPSTKSWKDVRLKGQYKMTVTVYKGTGSVTHVIDDIDITGNIYDQTYIQPLT